MRNALRILHLHGSFALGGKEARAVRLMNLWADRAAHVVLNGTPEAIGARSAIKPEVAAEFPVDAPTLSGRPSLGRFTALARYMRGFDLVLSYNWGAMDGVMAHRAFAPFMRLPPLVHHEDGFNSDEADGLKSGRNLYRRLALARASALVVPSARLERIALSVWGQAQDKVHLVPNGIALGHYQAKPVNDAIPGLVRSPGKLLVGTLAGLRPVKNIPRLVRAVAAHRARLQLVVVGEGVEREAIMAEAVACGITDLHMAGHLTEPWRFVGLFDIFALSSDSEQFPISLVEAMAAGLPAISTDVGDVAAMVARENRALVVPVEDEAAFTAALARLAGDAGLRRALGAANRARALERFGEEAMVAAYARIYGEAMAKPGALG